VPSPRRDVRDVARETGARSGGGSHRSALPPLSAVLSTLHIRGPPKDGRRLQDRREGKVADARVTPVHPLCGLTRPPTHSNSRMSSPSLLLTAPSPGGLTATKGCGLEGGCWYERLFLRRTTLAPHHTRLPQPLSADSVRASDRRTLNGVCDYSACGDGVRGPAGGASPYLFLYF